MMTEHEMALAWMGTAEGRAYLDQEIGRTPAEAIEKLKQRNPDYDHRAVIKGGFKSGPVPDEATCECGLMIRLVGINSVDGLVYTHERGRPATPDHRPGCECSLCEHERDRS